ncbi:MAG TPA: 7-carboxy-7-deazaguanine synthase QueE, partial [Candidatus Sabulitectum sp.]|nr:7-carboxy-7-deazaguanine synthase QueE [Candidatus Sabulitectum sp.]
MSEYLVKEIVPTLQGEGANTGMAVVLLRFSGCNLRCPWCDTEHQGAPGRLGGTYRSPDDLVQAAADSWMAADVPPSVLCTGGEPLLQLDGPLIREFRKRGIRILL